MRVVTFGEIMLKLQPEGYLRFFQNDKMLATFGGAEANVAVSLANFGVESRYVTKLPEGPIGQGAVNSLRYFGVDISKIARGGDRIGIYFAEKGASQRGSVCIYDRDNSAIKKSSKEDFDWNDIFEGADWFHYTGITPALGRNVYEILLEAVKLAKLKGLTVSCDLNYRSKLWSRENAREAMTELCKYTDIICANEEDAKDVFGINAGAATDVKGGKLDLAGYEKSASELQKMFGAKYVAYTLRTSINASENEWQGMIFDGKDFFYSKKYLIHIVDRVGGGDSFSAGLIYSLLNGKTAQEAVSFAVAASCLKHSIEGDFNMVSVAEVDKLAKGDGSGRVVR